MSLTLLPIMLVVAPSVSIESSLSPARMTLELDAGAP